MCCVYILNISGSVFVEAIHIGKMQSEFSPLFYRLRKQGPGVHYVWNCLYASIVKPCDAIMIYCSVGFPQFQMLSFIYPCVRSPLSVTGVTLILCDASSQTIVRYICMLDGVCRFAVFCLLILDWIVTAHANDVFANVCVGASRVRRAAGQHSASLLWYHGDHPDQEGGLSNQTALSQLSHKVRYLLIFTLNVF